jgi:hypothetical protein
VKVQQVCGLETTVLQQFSQILGLVVALEKIFFT